MNTTVRRVAHGIGSAILAVGIVSDVSAGARQPVPRSGGGAPRAGVPSHGGGSAPQRTVAPRGAVAPRGHVPPRGTATGIAHYGYGYGYGGSYWAGYPWWGVGYPYWGVGWYGDWWWGWPGYGYGYGGYGPWYPPYDGTYTVSVEAPAPHGPAVVETGVSPSKAEVVLDGESIGYASDYSGRWDRLTVAPGHHTIAFHAKGYRGLVVEFEARPGATYAFNDALVRGEGEEHRTLTAAVAAAAPEPRPSTPAQESAPGATGRLRVHAEPGDAAVYLDGEYLGLASELGRIHGALAVATGTHRLEAVRPGYVTAVRTIDVGGTDLATAELSLDRER